MLQERDDAAAEEKDVVMPKVLDARVEQSVRFEFTNPLVGQHGYLHVLRDKNPSKLSKEVVLKGSTPLHFAVFLRATDAVQVLLQAGSDPSLMDENNQTAYKIARESKDEKLIALFQQHRLFAHRLRKQARLLATECESSRKHLAQFQHDTRVLTTVRQTLMAQVVGLWWRYTTSIVRRQAVVAQKQALAAQLENLVAVSTQTVQNLEREKLALGDERNALQQQLAASQQQAHMLGEQLAAARAQLADRDAELADRAALRAEIGKLQSALKSSLELITTQQTAMLTAAQLQQSGGTVDAAAELVKLRQECAALHVGQDRARLAETQVHSTLVSFFLLHFSVLNLVVCKCHQLRSELEASTSQCAQLQSELTVLRQSSTSTADVSAHPEFTRMQQQLAAARAEVCLFFFT
jgi:hypothetical protein